MTNKRFHLCSTEMKKYVGSILSICFLVGCGSSDEKSSAELKESTVQASEEGNPLAAPVDYLGAINKANKFANKSIELAQVNKAMQEFKITEGRNPEDLAELVESGFLAQEPKAPYGMEVKYDPQTGKVTIQPKQ